MQPSPSRPDSERLHLRDVALTGAIALGAGATFLARTAEVSTVEARAFAFVNDLPDGLWPVVWLPMQVGSFAGSVVACAALATRARDRRVALAALAASQGAYWAAKGIKRVVARGRPASLVEGTHERERTSGLGYPSGHTAVAFALAVAIAPSGRRGGRAGLVAAAAFVGVARMYAGAHLPLDVVGGAALGIVSGVAVGSAT